MDKEAKKLLKKEMKGLTRIKMPYLPEGPVLMVRWFCDDNYLPGDIEITHNGAPKAMHRTTYESVKSFTFTKPGLFKKGNLELEFNNSIFPFKLEFKDKETYKECLKFEKKLQACKRINAKQYYED